jgi:hypothetical protein
MIDKRSCLELLKTYSRTESQQIPNGVLSTCTREAVEEDSSSCPCVRGTAKDRDLLPGPARDDRRSTS